MRRTSARAAATVAALILAGCEDATRSLAPSPRGALDTAAGGGSAIAYVYSYWTCTYPEGGAVNGDYCSDPFWSPGEWVLRSAILTAYADGSNRAVVADDSPGVDVAAPAWSPDGMRIAFQRGNEIVVVGVAGGNVVNLTNHPAVDAAPAWSPDGGTIAFSSDRGGRAELYLMSAADGSGVVQLTNGVGFAGNPAWSPDGGRIAFDCTADGGNSDVCAVDADGTGFVRLTSDPARDVGPAWSADGTRIAFATERFGPELEIAVMSADGSGVARLGAGVAGYAPAWSTDGTRIAFQRSDPYSYPEPDYLFVVNADGTGLVPLFAGGSSAWMPGDQPLPPLPPPPAGEPPEARIVSISCWPLTCTYGDGSWDDYGIVSRVWTFGDGTSLTEGNVVDATHTYAAPGVYVVTLTVADIGGQTSSTSYTSTVFGPPPNQAPVARFTAGCVVFTCTFDSGASTDDSGIVARSWSFGDGATSTAVAPAHGYAAAGTYAVTLTVTDGAGKTGSSTQSVTVIDSPPVARFTASCTRTTCTFDGRTSTDDRGIVSYAWKTGNPSSGSATGAVVTVDYKRGGSYAVTLTVGDAAGQTGSLTQTVTVVK